MILTGTDIFGASSSGIGALGVSWSAFIIQLITFLLAYLVLRKWAFGPILKVLRERRETIAQGVTLGEQMQKEKAELTAKVEQLLADARNKADGIVADANEAGKDALHKAEADALAKADIIIKEAKEQTKHDIAQARRQLEADIVGLISAATEALTYEKVDTKKDAELIDRALAGAER